MIVCSFARCSKKEERKKGKGQALDFGGKYVDTIHHEHPTTPTYKQQKISKPSSRICTIPTINMTGGNEKNKLEMQIFDRFSKIAREKVLGALDDENKTKQLDALYSHPEFNEERRILNELNNLGLANGVMTALGCFAFLRWSPRAISKYLMHRRAARSGSESSGAHNPFSKTSSSYQFDPVPGQQGSAYEPSFVFRGLRLGLDIFVSMSIGAYASIFFVDKSKLLKQASEIPLVSGRSLLSEELCNDFSVEFKKYNRDTWDKNHPALTGGVANRNEKRTDFIMTVEGFVANCKRRAIYEKELRREHGLRDDEPVVIPSPGVPKDISVTLDDLIGDKLVDGEDNDESGEFYFDNYFDEGASDESTEESK